ncbi:fused response regulator/phosphatase [Streptomyces sp. NPDC001985]|uniref:PP2C family protein-serine/threonine phosphatase n=1 Tax=Streptomyces sp. NPDC001985 TaxID=3154406 RepID=UPI00331F796A
MGFEPVGAAITGGAGRPVPPQPGPAGTAPRRSATAVPHAPAWPEARPTVLLIEDDPGDALLVEELVTDSDMALDLGWARSLGEALPRIREERPHCVLLDLHLPDAQGLQALERVIEVAGTSAVLVLTGLAEEQAGLAAVTAGAQDYLVKGRLEPDLFARAVRYSIQRKHAELASAALQAERLRAEENSRLERGLLPTPLLRDDRIRVCARYRPGRAHALLGGDFYDVVQTRDGVTHAVIGDVSGHGPYEAALGVCLRVAWRSFVLAGVRGQRLLELLEEVLVAERSGPEIFASLTSLTLHLGERRAEVLRAGHPGFLIRSAAGVRHQDAPPGPVLGLLPEAAEWPATRLELPLDGAITLYTDGLIEGRTGNGPDRLGEEGLLALARRLDALPSEAFVDGLIDEVRALSAESGGHTDDTALLHLDWNEPT